MDHQTAPTPTHTAVLPAAAVVARGKKRPAPPPLGAKAVAHRRPQQLEDMNVAELDRFVQRAVAQKRTSDPDYGRAVELLFQKQQQPARPPPAKRPRPSNHPQPDVEAMSREELGAFIHRRIDEKLTNTPVYERAVERLYGMPPASKSWWLVLEEVAKAVEAADPIPEPVEVDDEKEDEDEDEDEEDDDDEEDEEDEAEEVSGEEEAAI